MEELDRILSTEPVIEPSAGFAARVMRQVHEQAAAPPPLEFPWRRFLPGTVGCGAAIVAAVGAVIANFDPAQVPDAPSAPAFDAAVLSSAPVLAGVAIVASLALAWLTVRLTAPEPRPRF